MKYFLKETINKITSSFGRFITLTLIVALGTGFFYSLKQTTPSIITSLNEYYKDNNLMEIKITSTLGLTNKDIEAIKEIDKNIIVYPSNSIDIISNNTTIRINSINQNINYFNLIAGRLPTSDTECLAEVNTYNIGDTIEIDKNDLITNTSFTVTGIITSPLYISKDKGITNVGTGKLNTYIYILPTSFTQEYYTEVYIDIPTINNTMFNESEYTSKVDDIINQLKNIKELQETARYEDIIISTTNNLNNQQDNLNNIRIEKQKELDLQKTTLDNTAIQLENNLINLNNNQKNLNQQKKKIEENIDNINISINNYNYQYNYLLSSNNLTKETLNNNIETLSEEIKQLEIILPIITNKDDYNNSNNKLTQLKVNLENLKQIKELENTINTLTTTSSQLTNTLNKEILPNIDNITTSIEEIKKQQNNINNNYQLYYQGLKEFNNNINTMQQSIDEARKQLNNLEKPIWYLTSRSDNYGYTALYEDSLKVEAISKIFPIFFILIVSLICLNTINRLVEEERTKIGTYLALGYNKKRIIVTYLAYVSIICIVGTTIGLTTCISIIPKIIYSTYTYNYILPPLIINNDYILITLIYLISFILFYTVTIYSSLKELNNKPATLLRKKPPKKGQKVFLEKNNFIWSKLNFTSKVTIRNLFRYKKRIIMTTLGVLGCTALLVTGFGLKDSISSIITETYNNITKYDITIYLKNNVNEIDKDLNDSLIINDINNYLPLYQETVTTTKNNKKYDIYLIATNKDISPFINLISTSKEETKLTDNEIIISEKIANILNIKINDNIQIRNSNNELYILKVGNIIKNYTMHYIYINQNYYEQIFNKELQYNSIIANINQYSQEQATNLIANDNISAINYTKDNFNTFNSLIDSLNKIIYLIITCAAILAFIVLYNLTTININERIREIATLKVLGFHNKEISNYIYRETIILTILGILLGLILGIYIHSFVITIAETDNIMFIKKINYTSFTISGLLTFIFAYIIQVFTHFKLKKVNMVEALKEVE
ncbi:MAG: FtsX-like permease family protein [bacterium]|nr:FtsX-like permease family protein [bacterium]